MNGLGTRLVIPYTQFRSGQRYDLGTIERFPVNARVTFVGGYLVSLTCPVLSISLPTTVTGGKLLIETAV